MPVGTLNTYDLTVGVMLDVEDMIHLLSPADVPLQGGGGADGQTVLSTGNAFEKKVEWQDEELLLPKTTAAAGATTAEGVLTVASGKQLRFSTGDVLLLKSNEKVRITGYGVTADTFLVTRGFAGSTAATITSGDSVTGVGTALIEGSNPEDARAIDRTNRYNFTQIFGPTSAKVSETENVVRKYGLGGTREFDHQVGNRTKEQFIARDQAILYGTRYESTTTELRTMGGFTEYISDHVDSTTTVLTEAKLLTQIQACYDDGGLIDRVVVGSTQKRTASALATGITIQVGRTDNGRGGTVDYLDSDFGRATLVLDRWVRSTDAFGFMRDQATLMTLRPMQFVPLAKTGDSIHGHIVSEITLKFVRQLHAFRFNALT